MAIEKLVAIEKIVILPVVDSRADKTVKVNFQNMRQSAQKILTKVHHYTISKSDNVGSVGEIVESNLTPSSSDWIKRLGPADARWVMVLGLSNIQGGRVTTVATVFGFLYDKEAGTLLWQASGLGQPSVSTPGMCRPGQCGLEQAAVDSTSQLADNLTNVMFPGFRRNEVLRSQYHS